MLVGFQSRATQSDRAAARSSAGAVQSERLSPLAPDAEKWVLRSEADLKAAIERLERNPLVRYAQPDYLLTKAALPDDPYYTSGSLWGMHGDQVASGANQYGSQADEAWQAGYTGSSSVAIGVIDEGIQYTHPDLADNVWTNPFDPVDGVDNDGNGYIDDVHGWDFFHNDNSVYDAGEDSHGTHVSGTIGGIGNNGIGVAGVNWSVTLISTKFLGPGGGYTSDAIRAADYLTDLKLRHGINVVASSNSWGGGGFDQGLLDAINRGGNAGILFVAAAGNSNVDNDGGGRWPSNYECTNGGTRGWDCVVAVAAIDSAGQRASFSSYGLRTVDLGAPGVSVISSVPTDTYASYSGTSMATPHVSGAVALCASINPQLSARQIVSAVLGSTAATASMSGKTMTGGRLDVGSLVPACLPAAAAPSGSPASLTVTTVGTSRVGLSWADGVSGETAYEVERAPVSGGTCGTFGPFATFADDSSSFTASGLAPSTPYCFRVRGTNNYNGGSASGWSNAVTVTTADPPPAYRCYATTYSWVDPAGGTTIALGDDSAVTVALPFTFTSYGDPYTSVTIASNGFLRLGAGSATQYANVGIPSTSDPNAMLGPLWDDWNPGAGGTVSYRTEGTAPARRFVVSWVDVPHFSVTGSAVTFQAILEEGGDVAVFQYQDAVVGNTSYDRGVSATVGIEGATGEWGTQVSYNAASVSDSSAYRCSAQAGVSPTVTGGGALADGTTGASYAASLSASGGAAPYTWSLASGSLPGGLSLSSATGAISGTPTQTGSWSFAVRATGSDGGSATVSASIRVAAPLTVTTSSLAGGTAGVSYSQTLASSGGQAPVSWDVASGSLPAGLSLDAATGAITGTPTQAGTFSVTYRATDSGQPAPRMAVAALELKIGLAPAIAGGGTLADGTTGTSYAASLSASGGAAPYTWSLASGSLPGGLSLSSVTGAISGTPTQTGSWSFAVRATGSDGGSATVSASIRVAAPLAVTTSSLAGGTAGVSYSQTLASSGGQAPVSWSVASGSLPAGLSLNATTGAITGTPTQAGTFSVTYRATDSGQPTARTATKALQIVIAFVKRAPADQARFANTTTSVAITWYAYPAATQFRTCFVTTTKNCSTNWVTRAAGTTSVTQSGLTAGKTYYWQVEALVGTTWVSANSGTIWRFTIAK